MVRVLTLYGPVLEGHEADRQDAIEFATNYDFSQEEPITQFVSYVMFEAAVGEIDIYYCYGTDSYVFATNKH